MIDLDWIINALMGVAEFVSGALGVWILWTPSPDTGLVAACFAFAVYMRLSRDSP